MKWVIAVLLAFCPLRWRARISTFWLQVTIHSQDGGRKRKINISGGLIVTLATLGSRRLYQMTFLPDSAWPPPMFLEVAHHFETPPPRKVANSERKSNVLSPSLWRQCANNVNYIRQLKYANQMQPSSVQFVWNVSRHARRVVQPCPRLLTIVQTSTNSRWEHNLFLLWPLGFLGNFKFPVIST